MNNVENRYVGENLRASVKMEIVSSKGKKKIRELIFARKDYGHDSRILFKFTAPKSMKGTGLLIYSYANEENTQWLYLSSARNKQPRRIAATRKDGSFIGSEFYYLDLEEKQAQNFSHRFVKQDHKYREALYVIESIPKDKNYPYSKIISTVDKASLVIMKAQCFKDEQLLKTITVKKVEKIENIWAPLMTEVENHKNNRKSLFIVANIDYNLMLPDAVFSHEGLIE